MRHCIAVIILIITPVLAQAHAKDESFSLNRPVAIVYDDNGKALFRGYQDFIRAYAHNPDGKVFDWAAPQQMVRISANDQDGLWLSCDEIQPIDGKCGTAHPPSYGYGTPPRRTESRGPGSPVRVPPQAVPMCPGDLRCPSM
jgi:hypothetical protein